MRREPEPAAPRAAAGPALEAVAALIAADEQLRAEVAESLHGKVQGGLAVVALLLAECRRFVTPGRGAAGAGDGELGERLREAVERLDAVRHGELEAVVRRLYPTALRLGLLPALDGLLEPYRRHWQVTLSADARTRALDDLLGEGLPPAVRLAAYRTIEAALACLAPGAKRLCVELRVQRDGGSADPPVERLFVSVSVGAGGRLSAADPAQDRDDSGLRRHLAVLGLRVEALGGRFATFGGGPRPTGIRSSFPLSGAAPGGQSPSAR